MKDMILKLRILAIAIRCAFDGWKTDVWRRDLDGLYCCDGRECCCGAMTVREAYWDAYHDR